MKTTTTIKMENNETLSRGVSKNSDGTYTALTFTASKTFKSLSAAQKWLAKRAV